MRKINEIIVHCSATAEGKNFKAADIDRWHRDRGMRCIGYHHVVDLDGKVEPGRPENEVGTQIRDSKQANRDPQKQGVKALKWYQRTIYHIGFLCCVAVIIYAIFLYLRRKK